MGAVQWSSYNRTCHDHPDCATRTVQWVSPPQWRLRAHRSTGRLKIHQPERAVLIYPGQHQGNQPSLRRPRGLECRPQICLTLGGELGARSGFPCRPQALECTLQVSGGKGKILGAQTPTHASRARGHSGLLLKSADAPSFHSEQAVQQPGSLPTESPPSSSPRSRPREQELDSGG